VKRCGMSFACGAWSRMFCEIRVPFGLVSVVNDCEKRSLI
jgi:hypothetical protein